MEQALGFQSIQGGVERAHGDLPSRASLDFSANGYAVRVPAQSQDSEKDNLLELAEVAGRHLFYIVDQMPIDNKRAKWEVVEQVANRILLYHKTKVEP
jgi:hypothetical protein